MQSISEIKEERKPHEKIEELLINLHKHGPTSNRLIESLSYYKHFHPTTFIDYEEKIVSALGLFYKNKNPNNLYSFILSKIGENYKEKFGEYLTPVQANIRSAIEKNQYISISAPTSAGKSFSIKDYIYDNDGDIVIIVPSRALIAEYIETMREKFNHNKDVMISSFVDNIFTDRQPRKIFILTPERSRDLFKSKNKFNINLFFFDEAHISEEDERGVEFDILIRRIKNSFPDAKLIFAHPFIENPEAQIKKHSLSIEKSYSRSYTHNTVGKIFIFGKKDGTSYYFTPFIEKCHLLDNCLKCDKKFEDIAFNGKKTVLVYVSKQSLYNGKFISNFKKHIKKFKKLTDINAIKIIESVEELLGANQNNHKSKFVDLLKLGIVIHHGSVPLSVRFLIEEFIKNGYAKVCFATSTLAQGVNMPFDIVWLSNMRIIAENEEKRSLAFKNLIGRSGRLSKESIFDYGYVYTENPKLLSERINTNLHISEESILDTKIEKNDDSELIRSISEGSFDEEMNLPISKIDRLSNEHVFLSIKAILDIIYNKKTDDNSFFEIEKESIIYIKENLLKIYKEIINRTLSRGEENVFNHAISIFIQTIKGRSFKEIVGMRYNHITNRGKNGNSDAKFLQPANKLPHKDLKMYSLFPEGTKSKDVSYDTVVFDTYDYLDTVISFSLTDSFIGAFNIYYKNKNDPRALKMIDLLRYGTNNKKYTLLMRYGFPPEDISEIAKYITSISEENIKFQENIDEIPEKIRKIVDWYLP